MTRARLESAFQRLREQRSIGLFPYLTAGFPDPATSQALAGAALDAGSDAFEIGVPFSDPLSDGATLQRANARALEAGATLDTAFDLVRSIRARSETTPVLLMSYYNPLRQRGEQRLAEQLAAIDADGVIVPDLPPEEAAQLQAALAARELAFIPFLAPTSSASRIAAVAALEPAFIYCVALLGVTGARQDLSEQLSAFLQRVRAATPAPLVVGVGISQPRHVRRVAELGASGAIVGSALADLVERATDPPSAARDYLAELKEASHSVGDPTPA